MKSLIYRIIFSAALLLFISTSTRAENKYIFRTFSPEGGFNYDGVKETIQDNEGFIWVLMDNGVYRFDGYEYKNYFQQFKEIDSEVQWSFNSITDGKNNKLYVNTNNGLFYYEKGTDSFIQVISHKIDAARVDNKGNLWIKENKFWGIWDEERQELYTPAYDGEMITYISNMLYPYNDDLYVLTAYSRLYKYNYSTGEFNLCFNIPYANLVIYNAAIAKGKLWVFKQDVGLLKLDLASSKLEDQFSIPENASCKDLYVDKKGNVWVGTKNGLYVLDAQTKEFSHYFHSKTDPFTVPSTSIWSICDDRHGNVWIGTYSGGLCYVNLDESKAITSFFPLPDGLSHVPVSGFAEDKDYIFIATEGGGFNTHNKKTGKVAYYNKENQNIASGNVKSLVVDKENNLWVSYFTGGLDRINRNNGYITNFRKNAKDANSLLSNDLRKIVLEADSGLWVAYQDPRLTVSYYSFRSQKFTHYTYKGENTNYYIFDILRSGDNKLWLLNHKKLYVLNLSDHIIYDAVPDDSLYLYGRSMCLDESGNIWIGTEGNGLIKYDTSSKKYVKSEKLYNYGVNAIYNILYDDGYLWLGTDNGLLRYAINTGNVQKFDKEDGAQGNIYYPVATMKSDNGDLYFGGTNGYTVVKPQRVSSNTFKPRVIISGSLIDTKLTNEPVRNSMVLNHNQSNFGFKFSSDNYLIPEKTHFRYRLRGYDNNWIETDAGNRLALYSKVPPGTYYFEVVAANNDGIWADTPTVVKIKRMPAPWLSWPAYVFYSLIMLGIAYTILRYYNEKKRLKMQLYLENIEKDKKEQIHQAQLRFFTNISHDFRTPLSLIIAALEKLRRDGLKEYYYRILNGNAMRLLNLVNELMDFRTVENGKMKLVIQPADINSFVTTIASDFIDYASQRNITFTVKCDPDLPRGMYVDKSIVEKVVMNLLNNAFKYTPDNGNITIETRGQNKTFTSLYKNNHTVGDKLSQSEQFSIIISDTGVGISGESISVVFERFYKVNTVNADSHLGTGIGLALVKSLVLLHKGNITIYSDRNKGTDMVVRLPVDKNVFDDSDFLKIREPAEETKQRETDAIEKVDTGSDTLEELEANVSDRRKMRVLIAEDNADLRHIIAEYLSDEYEVYQAIDGIEASKLVGDVDFDIIISDIMMPHKDGVSLCNDVKGDINTSHIPFILLTAKTGLESRIEGVDSGADLYFEKPVDLNYLKLSIQNIFRNLQQLKDHYEKNYYADSSELSTNEQDNKFLKNLTAIIDANLDQSELDVNLLASELSMSRSKLYNKIKSLTGKSIVEFVLNYRLRKAAKLIIEENTTMREVMERIGIESQAYFTNSFKKVFGETPTSFAAKHKKKK